MRQPLDPAPYRIVTAVAVRSAAWWGCSECLPKSPPFGGIASAGSGSLGDGFFDGLVMAAPSSNRCPARGDKAAARFFGALCRRSSSARTTAPASSMVKPNPTKPLNEAIEAEWETNPRTPRGLLAVDWPLESETCLGVVCYARGQDSQSFVARVRAGAEVTAFPQLVFRVMPKS